MAVLIAGFWSWLAAAARMALSWNLVPAEAAASIEHVLGRFGVPPRLPLVPWSPRRPVPWALIDLIALVGLWFVASVIVGAVLYGAGWIERAAEMAKLSLDQHKAITTGNLAVSLIIAGIGLPLVALRSGATLRDFGWSWSRAAEDLRLGLVAFVMLAPPVYALQGL